MCWQGLVAIRKLHMRAIEETGLTAADEMLYPENWRYLSDILSYVAIGARSVENQQHRLVVSGMACSCRNEESHQRRSFCYAEFRQLPAQHGHTFIYRDWEVKTDRKSADTYHSAWCGKQARSTASPTIITRI